MEDERDAEDAVRKLDRVEFGRKGRRLRVEWTKQERDSRRPGGGKKPISNEKPSRTLFVINFDPIDTKSKDLERHFEPYGAIANIRIRKNFAFIQFESQEEATKALEATNMSELLDRVITVEYAIRDDDANSGPGIDRRGRDRGREMSPERGGYNRRRSPSPYRRGRGSPDYGRGRDRDSPDYGRGRVRDSPDYSRGRVRDSPDHVRGKDRGGRDHRRDSLRGSPDDRGRVRGSPDGFDGGHRRVRGSPEAGGRDRGSPVVRGRGSPENGRGLSKPYAMGSPRNGRDESPDNGRYHSLSRSPPPRERSRS